MKKYFYILFVNLIFLFLLFFISNLIFEKQDVMATLENRYLNLFSKVLSNPDTIDVDISKYETEEAVVKQLPRNAESISLFCDENRREFGIDNTKNPITVLGCSYAYGHGLLKSQTFSYILSEITKRPVYNFSGCGDHLFVNFEQYKVYSQENKNRVSESDYVIYIYMYDHINRYLRVYNIYNNYYEIFEPVNCIERFLCKSAFIRYIATGLRIKNILKGYPDKDKSSLFLKKIMKYSINQIRKMAPNSKIIVILYDEKIPDYQPKHQIKFNSEKLNDIIWQELANEENIEIVHSKDIMGFLFDKNYKLKEDISDWHPNDKVWREFTPLFVKKYIK